MVKGCLVDWKTKDGLIVPWMIFTSAAEAAEARRTGHASWPHEVCEIEDEPTKTVPSYRAKMAEAGGRSSPFWPWRNETSLAYRALSVPCSASAFVSSEDPGSNNVSAGSQ